MNKELGRKLTEAHCNKLLICAKIGSRMLFVAMIVFACVGNKPVNLMAGIICGLICIAVIVFAIWPAIHFKDYVEFYENGICYRGQSWNFEQLGDISFIEYRSNRSFFTDIYMRGQGKRFNVTYIKDAKKQYNRAYCNYYQLEK